MSKLTLYTEEAWVSDEDGKYPCYNETLRISLHLTGYPDHEPRVTPSAHYHHPGAATESGQHWCRSAGDAQYGAGSPGAGGARTFPSSGGAHDGPSCRAPPAPGGGV